MSNYEFDPYLLNSVLREGDRVDIPRASGIKVFTQDGKSIPEGYWETCLLVNLSNDGIEITILDPDYPRDEAEAEFERVASSQ